MEVFIQHIVARLCPNLCQHWQSLIPFLLEMYVIKVCSSIVGNSTSTYMFLTIKLARGFCCIQLTNHSDSWRMIANSCFKIGHEKQKIQESKVKILVLLMKSHRDSWLYKLLSRCNVYVFNTQSNLIVIHLLFSGFVNYKPHHKICWCYLFKFCYLPSSMDRTHVFKLVLY